MIKKLLSFAVLVVVSMSLIACNDGAGATLKAQFNDNKIDSIVLGEMINFDEFIDYTDGAEVEVTYSAPGEENGRSDSLYFLTETLGVHKFSLTFSLGSSKKTLECEVNVVPPAPRAEKSGGSVYCTTGETVSFDALLMRSGLKITPVLNVNVDFKYVEYLNETISVDGYTKKIEKTEFSSADTGYTFAKAGSYVFYVSVNNASGEVTTSISASVLDESGTCPIPDVSHSGVIFGENNAVKVMSGGSSALSYIASSELFEVQIGEFVKAEAEFNGKNAPQIVFFTDKISGDLATLKGVGVTLEAAGATSAMSLMNGLTGKTFAVRKNSFGRETFKNGTIYRWTVLVTRISESKLAVKARLLEKRGDSYEETARFDWLSFEYDGESKGYIQYMGSASYGDVMFRYTAPVKCDKDGNEL